MYLLAVTCLELRRTWRKILSLAKRLPKNFRVKTSVFRHLPVMSSFLYTSLIVTSKNQRGTRETSTPLCTHVYVCICPCAYIGGRVRICL